MSPAASLDLSQFIRNVPDFPKPGIMFKDITPLLSNGEAYREAIARMAEHYRPLNIDVIAAAEARGFLFAAPLALQLGVGFVPIRKPGKLPYRTRSYSYQLEYGTDTLQMHVDGIDPGQRVLVIDDLLATGGTVEACCRMIEQCSAEIVGCGFLIELAFLEGAKRLAPYPIYSVLRLE